MHLVQNDQICRQFFEPLYIKGCDKCQKVKMDISDKKTPLNPNKVPDAP